MRKDKILERCYAERDVSEDTFEEIVSDYMNKLETFCLRPTIKARAPVSEVLHCLNEWVWWEKEKDTDLALVVALIKSGFSIQSFFSWETLFESTVNVSIKELAKLKEVARTKNSRELELFWAVKQPIVEIRYANIRDAENKLKLFCVPNVYVTGDRRGLSASLKEIYLSHDPEGEVRLAHMVDRCKSWLNVLYPWSEWNIKYTDCKINDEAYSYHLKHLVEEFYARLGIHEYIADEAMTIAMADIGYNIQICDLSLPYHALAIPKHRLTTIQRMCGRT
jgi:hypothetical protein